MKRLALIALGIGILPACVFVDHDDDHHHGPPVYVNEPPFIKDAAAGCFYDAFEIDDIWYFDAFVTDRNGARDVVQVWADVYDDRRGVLVESFELFPTEDPIRWYSDWLGRTTLLDCFYPYYTVDIVAYDTYDAFDAVTIYPDTYR